MTDLDERILKTNVPGKFTQWNECNEFVSKKKAEDGESDNGEYSHCDNIVAKSSSLALAGSNRMNNTGAKGVLQDYHDAKRMDAMQQAAEDEDKKNTLRRHTSGDILKSGEVPMSLASLENQKRQEKVKRSEFVETSDSDISDIEDDDFLLSYRQTRIEQMQRYRAWPVCGVMKKISIEQFISVVDEIDIRVFCIFHLYENGIAPCTLLNQHISVLAKTMDYCNFFEMKISEIKPNFDPIGFPCVLIYRGGKEVANLTPITEHIPSWRSGGIFTMEDIKNVLELHGVVDPNSSEH